MIRSLIPFGSPSFNKFNSYMDSSSLGPLLLSRLWSTQLSYFFKRPVFFLRLFCYGAAATRSFQHAISISADMDLLSI